MRRFLGRNAFLKRMSKQASFTPPTPSIMDRDPEVVARWQGFLNGLLRYYRAEIRGKELIPDGPALLVGNHSGGLYTPEVYVLLAWWVATFGPERPLYVLAHDFLFRLPWFGPWLRHVGVIPASHANAERALQGGNPVLVFPGGDYEAFRPYWHRNQVDFGGRKGFIRLAMRTGVPVVPIVTHGSHDTTFVLSRGERIARWLQLGDVFRIKIFPIVLGLPWGVAPGFLPVFPWPARITGQVLPPMAWPQNITANPSRQLLQQHYDEIIDEMQSALEALVEEIPWPLVM